MMAEKNDKKREELLTRQSMGKRQSMEEHPLIPPDEVPVDEALKDEPAQPLDWETSMELLESIDDGEAVIKEMSEYATLPEVLEDFAERQELDTGAHLLRRRLEEHHGASPELAADDIDAAWDEANVGEETVGGTNPTPDQDQVDEIGEAAGLTYEDDEPLNTGEKLEERDRHRWELNPESAEDEEEFVELL